MAQPNRFKDWEAEGKFIYESEQRERSKKGEVNVSSFEAAAQPSRFKDRKAEGKFINESEQRNRSEKGEVNFSGLDDAAKPNWFTDREAGGKFGEEKSNETICEKIADQVSVLCLIVSKVWTFGHGYRWVAGNPVKMWRKLCPGVTQKSNHFHFVPFSWFCFMICTLAV